MLDALVLAAVLPAHPDGVEDVGWEHGGAEVAAEAVIDHIAHWLGERIRRQQRLVQHLARERVARLQLEHGVVEVACATRSVMFVDGRGWEESSVAGEEGGEGGEGARGEGSHL